MTNCYLVHLIAAIFMLYLGSGLGSYTTGGISLTLYKIYNDGVLLGWTDTIIGAHVTDCELTYMSGTTGNIMPILLIDQPKFSVHDLKPNTNYILAVVCNDTSGNMHRSKSINFTTTKEGTKDVFTITQLPSTLPTFSTSKSGPPAVQKKRVVRLDPTLDAVLGVLFGIVGAVIMSSTGLYLWRKYRRRQRIRRFLSYRQQENEPFPDIMNQSQDVDME